MPLAFLISKAAVILEPPDIGCQGRSMQDLRGVIMPVVLTDVLPSLIVGLAG